MYKQIGESVNLGEKMSNFSYVEGCQRSLQRRYQVPMIVQLVEKD